MATTPAVKASTMKKVRDLGGSESTNLMEAIAATMKAGSEGGDALERLKGRLNAREKHKPDKIRFKK